LDKYFDKFVAVDVSSPNKMVCDYQRKYYSLYSNPVYVAHLNGLHLKPVFVEEGKKYSRYFASEVQNNRKTIKELRAEYENFKSSKEAKGKKMSDWFNKIKNYKLTRDNKTSNKDNNRNNHQKNSKENR